MAKKYKYSFTQKNESKEGLEALILSGLSFAAFLVLCILAFAFSGEGGTVLGAVGLVAMLMALYGAYLGLKGLAGRTVKKRYAASGTICAGIMSIVWLAVFLVGVK
jgi:hypothetical protein